MPSVLLLGFLIGLQHAMEADHVAAVASLVSDARGMRATVSHGLLWGLGHALTLFVFSGLVLMLNAVLPTQLAHMLELVVGGMLVLLGVDVLRRLYRERIHFHLHTHAGLAHFHAHAHPQPIDHAQDPHEHPHQQGLPWRALFVGMMQHGGFRDTHSFDAGDRYFSRRGLAVYRIVWF